MSYNPPTQQVVDNDTKNTPSNEAIFEALKGKANTNLQNLSISGSNGNVLTLVSGVPAWAAIPSTLPSQTGNLDKVLVTDGTNASWQYAGLGAGSLGTNNIVLGRSKPSGLTGTTNTIIGTGTTANAMTTANNSILIGNNTAPTYNGAESVVIGNSTTAGADRNVVMGHLATNNVGRGVQLGYNSSGGFESVGVGYNTTASGAQSTIIGANCSSTGQQGIVLGAYASADTKSITIGINSNSGGLSNVLAIGGDPSFQIDTVYLGQGAGVRTTANAVKIQTMRATGTNTNLSAGTLTLAGSQSTGNAAGGAVIIATAPAGASGSSLNAHVERLRVTATGNVQVPNYILSPQLFDAGTQTGNFSLDLGANGPCQQATINAAGPLVITLSNPVVGGAYLIKLVQGATPGTVTWPLTVKWGAAGVPTLSNTTGKIDIINLYWDGTNYFGTYALGF